MTSIRTFEGLCQEYAKLLSSLSENMDDTKILQHEFFKKYCSKTYQESCEPFYCSFNTQGECQFVRELGKLNKLFEMYGLQIKLLE